MKTFFHRTLLVLGGSALTGCMVHEHRPSYGAEKYDLINPAPIFADEEVIIISDPAVGWESHRHYKRRKHRHGRF